MFQPKYLKQAKMLKKGVRKFLRYKRDIISDEKMEEIRGKLEGFEEAVASKEKEAIKEEAKTLTRACEKAVPPSPNPGLRENLEVIFVAIIIAVGIRAYFAQPFRIPTGSMQPTLNGIIGHAHNPADGDFDEPGLPGKVFQKIAQGRTYVNFTIPAGAKIESIQEITKFKFFTSTKIHFTDPALSSIKVGIPRKQLIGDMQPNRRFHGGLLGLSVPSFASGSNPAAGRLSTPMAFPEAHRVQGYVDTGDQVLVNKFSYHFRTPKRGEVFVFNTRGIRGIPLENPAQGSQHYIKRLTGLPGDLLEIRQGGGMLYRDGAPATEKYIQRVWKDLEAGYRGYSFVTSDPRKTREWDAGILDDKRLYQLGDGRYMALGDNSYNSSDSRMWGSVPQTNLVGPALMVYWPFEHWGLIR